MHRNALAFASIQLCIHSLTPLVFQYAQTPEWPSIHIMAKTACAHYYLLHCLVLITGTQASVRTPASGVRIRQINFLFVTINKGSPKTLWNAILMVIHCLLGQPDYMHLPTH